MPQLLEAGFQSGGGWDKRIRMTLRADVNSGGTSLANAGGDVGTQDDLPPGLRKLQLL